MQQSPLTIISVREAPAYTKQAITYIQNSWPEIYPAMYDDCITNCIGTKNPLPQWYLLMKDTTIIGCAGLITNDFISRGDLYPWLCALSISEQHRGHAYASLLIEKAKKDTLRFGFTSLYLTTDLVGFYEKYGFHYLAQGYHPWEEEAKIYECALTQG